MPEARLQRTREAYRKPDAFIELVKKLRAQALAFNSRKPVDEDRLEEIRRSRDLYVLRVAQKYMT